LSGSISQPRTSCKHSATLPPPLHSRCPFHNERIEQGMTGPCCCSSGLLGKSGKLLAQWHLPGYSTSQLRSCGSRSSRSGHARHSMCLQHTECRSPQRHCSRFPLGKSYKGCLRLAALSLQDKLQQDYDQRLSDCLLQALRLPLQGERPRKTWLQATWHKWGS